MDEEQARERIKELRGYYGHLAAYAAVNVFLFLLNMITGASEIWFIYPLLGWGIGIAIHTFQVFWTGSDWEARKLEELTGLKQTQDELQRLSERTDALVTVLEGVNWEQIDPELTATRENLEKAQRKLQDLRERKDTAGQADVAREIERLERFVTSKKFNYYELASRPDGS